MAIHKLSDSQLRHATCPKGMVCRDIYDGGGLFLRVKPSGTKSWNFQWTCWKDTKKRPKMGLGAYPTKSLLKARIHAQKCREFVADRIDPRPEKAEVTRPETFADALHAYFEKKRPTLKNNGIAGRWMSGPENHVLPVIGDKPVAALTINDLVGVLEPIWQQEVGRKTLPKIVGAINNARIRTPDLLPQFPDISQSVKDRLPDPNRESQKHPALPWEDAPKVWLMLGDTVNERALKFYLLNIPRVANVTHARWDEINLVSAIWEIPDTKNGESFAAPLAKQSVAILKREASRRTSEQSLTGVVFPNPKSFRKGIVTENAFNLWMKAHELPSTDGRLADAHGLRATFGTWCGDEEVCDEKMAERCIQHKVESASAAAYLRSQLLKPRRRIMQQWADYVTGGERAAAESKRSAIEFEEKSESEAEPSGRTHRDIANWTRVTEDELREAREFEDAQGAQKNTDADDHYSQKD